MRFASPGWLWLLGLAVVLVLSFGWGSYRLERARRAYGEDPRLAELVTARTFGRRFLKAALATFAMVLGCLSAAEPQYGKGTRILPATNLDVVVVLDYSKSMYARDVAPYRMARAKIEVARLVDKLAGARFGAIAFAGEPIAYPLTSDGAAIKQFFRSFDPNDMAVGGTAIARALDAGKDLFARDLRAKNHEKLLLLVTDGEDLEGDPVEVARAAHALGIRIHVVQIGGRTPEPIPNILESGEMRGYRSGKNGELLTTSLTPEGEAQLRAVAEAGGGELRLAEKGEVGVDALALELRRFMTEELSEKVETVYADVYQYPLALALALLLVEGFVGTARAERARVIPPKGERKKRKPRRLARTTMVAVSALSSLGCEHYDRLFVRESPVVKDAIAALHEKNPERSIELLTSYLETGACESGVIGAGDRAKKYGDAAFDLGLAFHGRAKAGSGGSPAPAASSPSLGPPGPTAAAVDAASIDCALRVLAPLADDESHDVGLRARALYLMGNLELSRQKFRAAVEAFDRALALTPGGPSSDGLDPIGNDVAHNRAYALRNALEEERKKKEEEQKKNEEKKDPSKNPEDPQKPEEEKKEDGEPRDEEKKEDGAPPKKDESAPEPPEPKKSEPSAPSDSDDRQAEPSPSDSNPVEGPSASEDERILEMLEQAPTLQQEDAKKRQRARRARSTMEDK